MLSSNGSINQLMLSGYELEIVGEGVMNPSKNEFALTYISHRS